MILFETRLDLEWVVSQGFVDRQADESGSERYSLSAQGIDAHRRLVGLDRGNYERMRI